MVFKRLWSILTPIQRFSYSCCECTWRAPVVQQGSASETSIC